MAQTTRGQNSPPSYIDGISVKISEKYKPPKKINLALSYSQRLTLNKLIQDPAPSYDFTLEESVKSRVHEWRKVRSTLAEERKQRLQSFIEERQTKNWENSENVVNEPNEVLRTNKSNSDSDIATSDIINNKESTPEVIQSQKSGPYYFTESGVLIPMTFASQQVNHPTPAYQIEKQFNFSEFESDTSSPFDNMELKTINDLEELAEVLKRDTNSSPIVHNVVNDQSTNLNNVIENNYINNSTVNTETMYDNAYAYNNIIKKSLGNEHNIHSISKENHINGYYYNHSPIYNTTKLMYNPHVGDLKTMQARETTARKVTEIMKSLQEGIANSHIAEKIVAETSAASTRRNVDAITSIKKPPPEDTLDNPINNLSAELQKMAFSISGMGFPLPRVARACQALDGNQKKIVEHLLAMSELLDLGFSEENVVNALLKCNNDRDKALDLLIT